MITIINVSEQIDHCTLASSPMNLTIICDLRSLNELLSLYSFMAPVITCRISSTRCASGAERNYKPLKCLWEMVDCAKNML